MLFCMSLVCSLILLSSSLRRCCSGEKCAFISALTSWLWSAEGSTSSVFLATGSPQLGDSFTMRALVASAYFQNKKGFLYNKHLRNPDFPNSLLVRYLNINANWRGKYCRMVIVWNSQNTVECLLFKTHKIHGKHVNYGWFENEKKYHTNSYTCFD